MAGVSIAGTPALVVDVDSGRVLYAERATDPWFPASITKLMTTYVALDLVRSRKASMDQLLTISEEAAAQPPSKMGFKPGTQLTLDNALKIIMVKSANDIAQTIAENLGGSVEGFAALMNETSHRLGMRESRWFNPHGLPDDRQQTSARDMAILGRALLRDFPDHADLFHIGAIQFGRRIMRNHNGLIGRYPGADGMKTGFICAGGFNVVASATSNGRRLITVVLGSTSANERTLKAADLFDRGFAALGLAGQSLDELPPSSLVAPPNIRSIVCDRHGPVPAEEEAQPAVAASASGNADNPAALFSSSAFAFADSGGTAGTSAPRRMLGPRAHFEPIRVWIGPTPPAVAAKAGAPGDKAASERKGAIRAAAKVQPKPLSRAKAGAVPSAAQAFIATPTPSILDDGKGGLPKGALRPGAALAPHALKRGSAGAAPKAAPASVRPAAAGRAAVAPAGKAAVKAPVKTAAKPAGSAPADRKASAKPEAKRQAKVAKPAAKAGAAGE